MKKITFLSFCLVFFSTISSIFGQTQFLENDPCSAICLPLSGFIAGKSPVADGKTTKKYEFCDGGDLEYNPTWFKFVPSKTSIKFTFTTSNCVGGINSAHYYIYEGGDCNNPTPIKCTYCTGIGAETTIETTPFKTYYIEVDGCAESVCNFSISCNPSDLAHDQYVFQQPKISSEVICKGRNNRLFFYLRSNYKMDNFSVSPSTGSSVSAFSGLDSLDNVQILLYSDTLSVIKLCADVTMNGGCSQTPILKKVCYDITVLPYNQQDVSIPRKWENKGIASLNAESIIFDPTLKDNLYNMYRKGLFVSDNKGKNFKNKNIETYVSNYFPTVDTNIIYVEDLGRANVSFDKGNSWEQLQAPIVIDPYNTYFINPFLPNNILVYDGILNSLYISKDTSRTYKKLDLPVEAYHVSFDKNKYYFLTRSIGKFFTTTDFVNFNTINIPNASIIEYNTIVSSISNGEIQYYASSKSANGDVYTFVPSKSNSWVFASKLSGNAVLYTSKYSNSNEVYADVVKIGVSNFYKSVDFGKTWKTVFTSSDFNQNITTGWIGKGSYFPHINSNVKLSINPYNGNEIVVFHFVDEAYAADTYISKDGAATWSQIYTNKADENIINTPVDNNKEYADNGVVLGISPSLFNERNTTLSLTDKNTIFYDYWKSNNDGKSWIWANSNNSPPNGSSNVVRHPSKNILFTGSKKLKRLYYSLDNGKSWKILTSLPVPVVSIALHPSDPNIMYIGGANQVWKTLNLDKLELSKWSNYLNTIGNYINEVLVLKDSTLLIGTSVLSATISSTNAKQYYLKEPKNSKLRLLDYGLMSQLIIDPFDSLQNTFYATLLPYSLTNLRGIAVSKDKGNTWSTKGSGLISEGTSLAMNPFRKNNLYIGCKDGVWYCHDITANNPQWQGVFASAPLFSITELKFNPYEKDELWVVSANHGLFKTKVPIQIQTNVSNEITCKNTSAELSATLNNNIQNLALPLKYSWSGPNNFISNALKVTVSPSVSSTYYITIKDANGQEAADSISVLVDKTPPEIVINKTPASGIVCNGQTVKIDALSASSNYIWSNGSVNQSTIIVAASGKYIVTVTGANACISTAFADVNISPALQKATQVFFIVPASKTLKVSLLAVVQTANPSVKSVTPAFVSIKENPGVYLKKYTYTDQNGCTGEVELNVVVVNKVKKPVNKVSKNNPIQLDENLASKLAKEGISLDEITFDAPLLVFPNPSEGVFNLAFADETLDFSAEIFDMTGKKIFSAQNQTKIDLSSFAKGSYLLKVNTKEEFFTQVLILQ